jgi:hypothetical protein
MIDVFFLFSQVDKLISSVCMSITLCNHDHDHDHHKNEHILADTVQNGLAFCQFNNVHLVQQCDIVFLCVGPKHMRYVVDDLRSRIKPHVLIYSLVLGFPALKLSSLLQHRQIIKPSYQLNPLIDTDRWLWPIADNIDSIVNNEQLLKRICLECDNTAGTSMICQIHCSFNKHIRMMFL